MAVLEGESVGPDRAGGGPGPHRPKSLGRTVLNKVFSGLGASHEWITCQRDGFTWWASGHATRVWAEPPVTHKGFELTRPHASTAFVRDASAGDRYDSLRTGRLVAPLVHGKPDVGPHPKSGLRSEAAASLGYLEAISTFHGKRPSAFEGDDLLRLARTFEGPP